MAFEAPLAWCTLCPIQWRPLLGLAEVWVVGVAAPQLLAGFKGSESQAGVVPSAKVEPALLVHGVVDPGQFRGLGPGALEGVIKEAIVGSAAGTGEVSQP